MSPKLNSLVSRILNYYNRFVQILVKTAKGFIESFFIAALVLGVIYWLIGLPLKITGNSMFPTFSDGEQIVSEKITFSSQDPKRGDIVIFKHPENNWVLAIKRVIGLPGDTILISDGKVFLNDSLLVENYLSNNVETVGRNTIEENVKITVPEKNYILLGDNRENSIDSRIWGFVPRENIIGKAYLVYYPFEKIRLVD